MSGKDEVCAGEGEHSFVEGVVRWIVAGVLNDGVL